MIPGILALSSVPLGIPEFNGKGYPDGLAGEQIPLHARIMAIADVFDTVSQKSCYRDTTTVYKLADGRYMDRTNTVYTFDGVDTWTDESDVEWIETAQTSEAEENVQDPYDLYSWDPETGTYIPYQQADGNGEAIGRGNGWYYYDDEAGAYIPW